MLLEGMYHFVLQNKIYIRTDGDATVRSVAWVNVALYQVHTQRLRTEGAFVTKSEKLSNHILTNAKTCCRLTVPYDENSNSLMTYLLLIPDSYELMDTLIL